MAFSPRARGCSVFYTRNVRNTNVFPACAGMFPNATAKKLFKRRFPRVRGDVPRVTSMPWGWVSFSPRARGCSRWPTHRRLFLQVFPACAGMFPVTTAAMAAHGSFPRVRGDVPVLFSTTKNPPRFSPRARGCSLSPPPPWQRTAVFPACAGMFPFYFPLPKTHPGFPRVRGDVPSTANNCSGCPWFSPRARGCSPATLRLDPPNNVFPACAGMFLRLKLVKYILDSFPRVRGDVPRCSNAPSALLGFSPRARGCSAQADILISGHFVFPACAGMFLGDAARGGAGHGFPRVRGDVPVM